VPRLPASVSSTPSSVELFSQFRGPHRYGDFQQHHQFSTPFFPYRHFLARKLQLHPITHLSTAFPQFQPIPLASYSLNLRNPQILPILIRVRVGIPTSTPGRIPFSLPRNRRNGHSAGHHFEAQHLQRLAPLDQRDKALRFGTIFWEYIDPDRISADGESHKPGLFSTVPNTPKEMVKVIPSRPIRPDIDAEERYWRNYGYEIKNFDRLRHTHQG
jgi:hypothetical protein